MRTFSDISDVQEYVPHEYILKRYAMSYKTLDRLLAEIPELHQIELTRPGKAIGRRLVHWPSFKEWIQSRRVPKKEVLQAA